MATKTRALKMPNGTEYEFFGATYYGRCTTAGSAQTKEVSIPGFTSASLVEGVRVVVNFAYAQSYNGTPRLNVSSTGDKSILCDALNNASTYEWNAGAIIPFTYSGNTWRMEGLYHATDSTFGIVKTTPYYDRTSTTDWDVAAHPAAIKRLLGDLFDYAWNSYDGGNGTYYLALDSATPSESQWVKDGLYYYTFSNINWYGEDFADATCAPRMVVVNFNNKRYCFPISPFLSDRGCELIIHEQETDNEFYINIDGYTSECVISTGSPGVYPIKIECYLENDAGFVAYPMLKDELSKYLTLADLPIYDGSSSPVTPSSP